MAKSKKITGQELEILALELKTEVTKFQNALSQLETDLGLLQSGDAGKAYWSGPGAYTFTKSCLGNLDHDKNLLKNVTKCSEYLEKIAK